MSKKTILFEFFLSMGGCIFLYYMGKYLLTFHNEPLYMIFVTGLTVVIILKIFLEPLYNHIKTYLEDLKRHINKVVKETLFINLATAREILAYTINNNNSVTKSKASDLLDEAIRNTIRDVKRKIGKTMYILHGRSVFGDILLSPSVYEDNILRKFRNEIEKLHSKYFVQGEIGRVSFIKEVIDPLIDNFFGTLCLFIPIYIIADYLGYESIKIIPYLLLIIPTGLSFINLIMYYEMDIKYRKALRKEIFNLINEASRVIDQLKQYETISRKNIF